MRLDTGGDMGFTRGFFAGGTSGREGEMADWAFVFFAELGWTGRKGCGDVEHGSVAGAGGHVACGGVVAVVRTVGVRA